MIRYDTKIFDFDTIFSNAAQLISKSNLVTFIIHISNIPIYLVNPKWDKGFTIILFFNR